MLKTTERGSAVFVHAFESVRRFSASKYVQCLFYDKTIKILPILLLVQYTDGHLLYASQRTNMRILLLVLNHDFLSVFAYRPTCHILNDIIENYCQWQTNNS